MEQTDMLSLKKDVGYWLFISEVKSQANELFIIHGLMLTNIFTTLTEFKLFEELNEKLRKLILIKVLISIKLVRDDCFSGIFFCYPNTPTHVDK
ncbi:CLUMA_CG012277, isoform A [Clunio marinus]|uniref:CLUMA_CG012277, isoform A n=1 Tax=Clunio marinus TaxID=568069 RepID=A0A1J1IFZ6_9DIPT|nr:CLUMA_CG012277, isoform A [Clunio marinus]